MTQRTLGWLWSRYLEELSAPSAPPVPRLTLTIVKYAETYY